MNMTDLVSVPCSFKGFLRYRTSILRCTPKKFKAIARNLKHMKLQKAIDCLDVSNKRVCEFLRKDIMGIFQNIKKVRGIDEEMANNMQIAFIVIEKRRKQLGTRFKARGRGSRSCTYNSSVSIYIKHDEITDFSQFLSLKEEIIRTESKISEEDNEKVENKEEKETVMKKKAKVNNL